MVSVEGPSNDQLMKVTMKRTWHRPDYEVLQGYGNTWIDGFVFRVMMFFHAAKLTIWGE